MDGRRSLPGETCCHLRHTACWVACIRSGLSDVLCDHAARTNHNIITNADWHDGGVGSDTHTVSDMGFFPLCLISTCRPSNLERVIDEHRPVADETVFSNGHEFTNKGVRLYTGSRTDTGPSLDFNEGADENFVAQGTPIEIDWFNQCHTFSKIYVDDTIRVDFGLSHASARSGLRLKELGQHAQSPPRRPNHMVGAPQEIEFRYFIEDPTALPALGKASKIIQCYLPKWKIELIDGNLCFEDRILVKKLPDEAVLGLTKLIEESKVTPRIRLRDDRAFVTVKGKTVNYSRPEWEFEVLRSDVEDLVTSFRFPYVMKNRYKIPAGDGLVWEIDFFEGDNHGLVLAEIEVVDVNYVYKKPEWLGPEVTDDDRFGSGSLAREAWCDWLDEWSTKGPKIERPQ